MTASYYVNYFSAQRIRYLSSRTLDVFRAYTYYNIYINFTGCSTDDNYYNNDNEQ